MIWLLRKLRPDFITIADFRRDNGKGIKSVCGEFTLLCRKLELFGGELVAIDGRLVVDAKRLQVSGIGRDAGFVAHARKRLTRHKISDRANYE